MNTNRKIISTLSIIFCNLVLSHYSTAQDTQVIISSDTTDRPSAKQQKYPDTVQIGPVTVIQCRQCGDSSKTNTTVKIWEETKPEEDLNDVDISWFGFDLGWNNFTDRTDYSNPEVNDFVRLGSHDATADVFSVRTGKSINVNIWPIWAKINLLHHYLNLKTGFGIVMNNYRYTKNISYVDDVTGTYIFNDSVNFKKNKLFTEYLTIPLLLNVETNPHHVSKSFRVSVGPTFGYLVKSRTKQKSEERRKVKNNNNFNLEKFRFGLRTELGFGPFTLYSAYSFTPIHQYGVKQYPYSIGIVIIGDNGW